MFNVDYPVTQVGEYLAAADLAEGVCMDISANSTLALNGTIGDRTFALNARAVLSGQPVKAICGAGAIFSTDQHADDMAFSDILVCGADGLLKKVVTPGTDFEVAECISNVSGILIAKLLI